MSPEALVNRREFIGRAAKAGAVLLAGGGISSVIINNPHNPTGRVYPRALVEARATGALSGMLGVLLELGGSSPNDQARQQVAQEGSQRLRERFPDLKSKTFVKRAASVPATPEMLQSIKEECDVLITGFGD